MSRRNVKWERPETCFHCGQGIGPMQAFTPVQEATKPRGDPHRWVQIGGMCEDCEIAGKKSYFEFNRR
jgi:hypothetical protein